MNHDVFVSYTKDDKVVADSIVANLESNDIRCYYAPRDIKPGEDWGKAITDAIKGCKIFLLVFSGSSNKSRRVLDELNLAISTEKVVLPFRIENLEPSDAMMLHLTSRHWLDAYSPSWEKHLNNLAGIVASNLDKPVISSEYKVPDTTKKNRTNLYIGVGIGLLVIIATLVILLLQKPAKPEKNPDQQAAFVQPETTATETVTPTETLIPTSTDLPTPEPTQTPTSTSVGEFMEFNTDNISIMLPEDWISIDLDKEGVDAILTILEEVDPALAENITSTITSDEMQEMGEFWAIDSKGLASANLMMQVLTDYLDSSLVCMMMPGAYREMGLTVNDSRCNFSINQMDVSQFEVEMNVGPLTMAQYQYIYMDNLNMWVLTLSVEKAYWDEYQPIFESIAETFKTIN